MPGNLSLETLKEEVAVGAIDTVNVVFVDMQGRLMGKRFHAEHFVDAHDETHACNTCSPSTSTWSRCPDTRRPRGPRATATSC